MGSKSLTDPHTNQKVGALTPLDPENKTDRLIQYGATTRRACTKFRHERMHSPDWRSMRFLWTSEGISSAAAVLMECSVFTTMRCDKTPRLGHRQTLKCLGCKNVEKVDSKGALEQRSREQRSEHHQLGSRRHL